MHRAGFSTHKSAFGQLVPIVLWLKWTLFLEAQVLRLLISELGEIYAELLEVQSSNLLIEYLRKNVYANWVLSLLRVELDLSEGLVRE